jgi:DNA-binding GntR family transcriptional regulator
MTVPIRNIAGSADDGLVSSVDLAKRRLREAITCGEFTPGDRLVEANLAKHLGMSRGPIRDALRDLAAEGLVVLRRNRGAVVTEIHVEDVLEVYAMRSVLGPLALRQLMSSPEARGNLVPQLKAYIRQAKSKEARADQRLLVEADSAFQTAIARASRLRRISDVFAETSAEAKFFVGALRIRYTNTDLIIEELEQLAKAIAGGDLATAERVWQARFSRAAKEFIGAIAFGPQMAERWPHLFQIVDSPGKFFERCTDDPPAVEADSVKKPRRRVRVNVKAETA